MRRFVAIGSAAIVAAIAMATGCFTATESPVAAAPAAMPDLPHGQCENGATGADSYFVGRFTIDGEAVTGTETWVLYANDAWVKHGGNSCTLSWNVKGNTAPHGKCAGCALSIQFHAEPDVSGSNCPAELLTGRQLSSGQKVGSEAQAFDQLYDVMTQGDGAAVVTFGKSGKELGRGSYTGGVLTYTSGHQCKFF